MLSLFVLVIVAFASVQLGAVVIKAKIPFAFTVEGKVLPAGQYEFIPDNPETIRVQGSGAGAIAMVMTRLAGALHTTPQDAHIVFDKVGDKYTLSEIWPLTGDGYLLYITKGKHEHHVVNVPK